MNASNTSTFPRILIGNLDLINKRTEGQCDCACASMSILGVPEAQNSSLWIRSEALHSLTLSSTFELVSPLEGKSSAVVLNQSAKKIMDAFATPIKVEEALLQTSDIPYSQSHAIVEKMKDLQLLVPFPLFEPSIQNSKSEILTAWLHITDRCNLRCTYCYLPHVKQDMSIETGYAAIDAVFRSAVANGFQQVKLKYAGGEPLLRFPLINELNKYALRLARQHGILIDSVVLSNGTLLNSKIIASLKLMNIRLMISLDGLGDFHNHQRPYAGGQGTFEDVASAIQLSLLHDLVPDISITISGHTVAGLPSLTAWILEHDLPFSFNFYRENELSLEHKYLQLNDEKKIIEGILTAFNVIESNLPRRSLLSSLVDRANLSVMHTHTCGVGQDYLVFDQNGQVGKCQMHIRNSITDMHADDPLSIIRLDQIGIQNISVEDKQGCRTCEWKYWCTGGCPLATYRATGRYDVKSPNCNIYKALYPEALRLEGLRLLKYQDDPEVVLVL
jgi:uncharacterized protein